MASKEVHRQWTCPKCARTLSASATVRGRISAEESAKLSTELMQKKIHHKKVGCENDPAPKSGCFITSACVASRGLPDDCNDLAVLRSFRDSRLAKTRRGRLLIDQYYRTAPEIVSAIDRRGDAAQVWQWVYDDVVAPTVRFVEAGRYGDAIECYTGGLDRLRRLT